MGDGRGWPAGLTLRGWQDDADYAAMAAIANATAERDGRDGVMTPAGMAYWFSWLAGHRPDRDIVLAEVDGTPVGWAGGGFWRDEDGSGRILLVQCRVAPAARRRGIGSALLAASEAIAVAADGALHGPAAGERRFEAWVQETEVDTLELLRHRGYAPVRWGHHMHRPLDAPIPDVALPAGIVVRDPGPDDVERVLLAWDEASRDAWEYGELTLDQLRALLADPTQGQVDRWVVAWDGDEPVAGILGWIDEDENRERGRRRGYCERIWTRRPWRRRGIATALLAENLRRLRRAGMTEAALSVDADNPNDAGSLYTGMGFVRHAGLTMLRRPVPDA